MMMKSQVGAEIDEDNDMQPPTTTSLLSFAANRSSMLGSARVDTSQHHAHPLDAEVQPVPETASVTAYVPEPVAVAAQPLFEGAAAGSAPNPPAPVALLADDPAHHSASGAPPMEDEADSAHDDKYVGAAELDDEGVPKIQLYCMCQQPWNPNQFMVACDDCDEWYHDTCLGVRQEALEKVDKYICPWCQERRKRRDARRKAWEAERAARKAAKKKKLQLQARELNLVRKGTSARGKPCKNTECTKVCIFRPSRSVVRVGYGKLTLSCLDCQRPRPNSKYCSDECGLIVAAQTHG
jgi:hypothetical protein